MKITPKKFILGLAVFAALPLSMANSCDGGGTFKDVENVKPIDADKYILINNVDGYPNVTIICFDAVALTTTTRDQSQAALQRIPQFDNLCPGYKPPAGN